MTTTIMTKKIAGRVFEPKEFRKYKQCLSCGFAILKNEKDNCYECIKKDLKFCEVCEIILRSGLQIYYSYDIREQTRSEDLKLKISKEPVREFIHREFPLYPKATEVLCTGCIDWKSMIKDICVWCDNDFVNGEENYKLNGNSCNECTLLHSQVTN